MWKKGILGILGIIVVAGVAGSIYMFTLVDLQTDYVREKGSTKAAQARGRQLLFKALEKWGGMKAFQAQKKQVLKAHFKDIWEGKIFQWFIMPQEFQGQKTTVTFQIDQWNGRVAFLDGKRQGGGWGLQQWVTYNFDAKGKRTWKPNADAKFWVPTYQYFVLMPFYVAEAQLLTYAGEAKTHGETFDLVLATWKSFVAQKDIDQYLVWIHRKSGTIRYIRFTIRDNAPRLEGTAYYNTKYQKVGNLLLPRKVTYLMAPGAHESVAHTFKVSRYEVLKDPKPGLLVPDPKRRGKK